MSLDHSQHIKIEEYRGFDIINYKKHNTEKTGYIYIAKNGEAVSCIALNSIRAARNVIDTPLEKFYPPNIQIKKASHL